ncbi:MAG: acyl-CoA dehydrogenase family protein [Bryobacteraceae bacterium]|nr:acyl-CoA dehydrogenase family protein [Bryobacteraceae bacterium]
MAIDFSFPPEIEQVRLRVRDFICEVVRPREQEIEQRPNDRGFLIRKILEMRQAAREWGLWLPHMPKEYGGMGLGHVAMAAVQAEAAKSAFGPYALNAQAPDEGNMHLLDCVGTENVFTIQPGCRLRRVLAHAERIQLDYLNSVRLSDVVEPGGLLREFERSATGGLGTPPKEGMTLVQIAPSADAPPVEPMLPPAGPWPSLSSEGSAARISAAQDCAAEATSDQPHPPPPIRRDTTAADNHPS